MGGFSAGALPFVLWDELQQGGLGGMAACLQHPEKRSELWSTVSPEVLPAHVDVGKSNSNPELPSLPSPPQGWTGGSWDWDGGRKGTVRKLQLRLPVETGDAVPGAPAGHPRHAWARSCRWRGAAGREGSP